MCSIQLILFHKLLSPVVFTRTRAISVMVKSSPISYYNFSLKHLRGWRGGGPGWGGEMASKSLKYFFKKIKDFFWIGKSSSGAVGKCQGRG